MSKKERQRLGRVVAQKRKRIKDLQEAQIMLTALQRIDLTKLTQTEIALVSRQLNGFLARTTRLAGGYDNKKIPLEIQRLVHAAGNLASTFAEFKKEFHREKRMDGREPIKNVVQAGTLCGFCNKRPAKIYEGDIPMCQVCARDVDVVVKGKV